MSAILPQQPARKFASVPNTSLPEGGKPIPPTLQTVLLAEDDALLREVMEAYLGMMGYVVIPCGDAHVASQAFQSSTIDILLTDFQMPGRSGVELARELTQLRPTLPVMIVSGSILPEELISEIQHRNWRFVAKPCSLTSLLETMQSLLSLDQRYAA